MLIGREREHRLLHDLLAASATGSHVLVQGSRGAGKSALLRAFVEKASAQGRRVISAAGDRADPALGFASRLLTGSRTGQDTLSPQRLDEMVTAVLSGSEGRVAVALDDLHLADGASLQWLGRHLLRRPAVPVLATLRPQTAATPAALEVGALLPCFEHRIYLAPLTHEEIHCLLAAELGAEPTPAFVEACHHATAGIPGVVSEVASLARAHKLEPDDASAPMVPRLVPREVGRELLADIAAGGDESLRVALSAAVIADSCTPALLASVTGLPQSTVADRVHSLCREGIVKDSPHGPRFAAPAVAAALADEVPPSRRRELHTRAARHLLDIGAPWDALTPHLLHSRRGDQWVAEALLRAADEARSRDNDSAVACLRRALREPLADEVRAFVLLSLGEAELTRCAQSAVRSLRSGLRLSPTPDTREAAARSLACALFALNRYPEGIQVLRDAVRELRPGHPARALRTEIDLLYAQITYRESAGSVMTETAAVRSAAARQPATERSMAALLSLLSVMRDGSPEEALAHAETALADGVLPPGDESFVFTGAVLALAVAGRPEAALSVVDASVKALGKRGAGLALAYVRTLRVGVNFRLGNVVACIGDAQEAVTTLHAVGADCQANHSVALWADCLLKQGRPAEAQDLLDRYRLTGVLSQHWANDFATLVRGRVRLALGQPRQALADFLDSGERARARGMVNPAILPWRSEAALVCRTLGDLPRARELAEEELALAQGWGVPEYVGGALRAAGVVAGGAEGVRLLREAVAALEGTSARVLYAQALLDCGVMLADDRALTEARTHLQQAFNVADRSGASAIALAAENELRRSGYRPNGPDKPHGVEALTPSELRVAKMAAEGMTNRAIAGELFVELRTVELHLSRTYRKLGIAGRAGLGEALGSRG
ncbi:LuxR C-terminal-related transcriptional regulator [Streptomyces sp. NPDC101116]|uniref:helix-turn-helix transcriptional regulator n=1 Tax=Streptomyces sp. NPDC101116 TaxID=3366107 RepID=UPI00380D6D05